MTKTEKIIIDSIAAYVCERYNIAPALLHSKTRHRRFVMPRHIIYTILRDIMPSITTIELGALYAGRDHSTVVSGIKRIRDICSVDKLFCLEYGIMLTEARRIVKDCL